MGRGWPVQMRNGRPLTGMLKMSSAGEVYGIGKHVY